MKKSLKLRRGARGYNNKQPSRVPRQGSGRQKRLDTLFGYGLLTPQIAGFAGIGLAALFTLVGLSLTETNVLTGEAEFIGLENYRRAFTDPNLGIVLPNTGFFVVTLSVLGTLLSLLLALLLNVKLRAINFFRAVVFVPALVTMVAWVLVWNFIAQPDGILDAAVSVFGESTIPWLRSRWVTLTLFVLIQLLKNVGINMMLFLAALQGVPSELKEAAQLDGAGKWRVFTNVTLPQISPAILMVFMLMIVGSFKVFEVVLLMTNGGPGVQSSLLSFEVYRQAFRLNDVGYASALALVLFFLVLLLTAVVWQFRKKLVHFEND